MSDWRFGNILANPRTLVWWTIIVCTAIRLVLSAVLGYGYGEGYYLASGRHFALSYFDQPPLSLWVAWASIKLFGVDSALLIRLPFVLMFAATTWGMYRLGAMLFGERAGALAALLLNLSPVFTISVAGWVQPDGPLMLLLVLAALPIASLRFGEPKHPLLAWAAAGAAFGLALVAKYHAGLILVGLFIFVVTTWHRRAWFFKPGLAVAALIAAVIVSPVIIWNSENGWVSFFFQGDRLIESSGLRVDWLLRSLAGQALIIGVIIWPPMIYVFVKALAAGPRDPETWFLCSLAIVPIIVFTIAALWAPLGYHFHWQAPGYLFLFPLLGKFTAERLEAGFRSSRWWLIAAGGGMALAVVVLATQAATGWMRAVMPAALTAGVEQAANPTRELLDWKELRQDLAERGLLDQPRLFVVSPQWHQAGKVDVQVGDKLPVVCLCHDPRNIAFGWNPRDFIGWDALIIGTDAYIPDVHAAYDDYFRSIEPVDSVDIHLGGYTDLTVRVYLAKDYYRPYPLPVGPGGSLAAAVR
jgi:hypothetical protein